MRVPFAGQEKCRDAVRSLYSARSEPTMSRRVLSSPNHTSGLILVNIEGRLANDFRAFTAHATHPRGNGAGDRAARGFGEAVEPSATPRGHVRHDIP